MDTQIQLVVLWRLYPTKGRLAGDKTYKRSVISRTESGDKYLSISNLRLVSSQVECHATRLSLPPKRTKSLLIQTFFSLS